MTHKGIAQRHPAHSRDTRWQAKAACIGMGREFELDYLTTIAKRTCGSCEVTADCLAYALKHKEHSGIWGGHSPASRDGMRRKVRA